MGNKCSTSDSNARPAEEEAEMRLARMTVANAFTPDMCPDDLRWIYVLTINLNTKCKMLMDAYLNYITNADKMALQFCRIIKLQKLETRYENNLSSEFLKFCPCKTGLIKKEHLIAFTRTPTENKLNAKLLQVKLQLESCFKAVSANYETTQHAADNLLIQAQKQDVALLRKDSSDLREEWSF